MVFREVETKALIVALLDILEAMVDLLSFLNQLGDETLEVLITNLLSESTPQYADLFLTQG